MQKTTLYITRHGETRWNKERIMQGWSDSPLTERGILQASWLHDALQPVDFAAIHASTSSRASHTAEIIRGEREIKLELHDELREIYLGDWEGKASAELERSSPTEFTHFWEAPDKYQPINGGESFYDLQKRVLPFLQSLLAQHIGETILIVTHTVTLKTIVSSFEKRPLAELWNPPFIHPTSLCKIVIDDQEAVIELNGDTSHYREVVE